MTTPPPVLGRYIPNAVQLTIKLNHNGQAAAVVLGATRPSVGATPGIAEAWRDAFWTAFRPLICSTTAVTGAVLRDVSGPDGDVSEVGAPTTNAAGFQGLVAAVGASAALIKWSTATGGRTGKGRTYIPGLPRDYVGPDGRLYTAQFQTEAQARINNYLAATIFASDFRPAVLSFTRGAARPITGGSPASVVGLQRRRMR
jgi:hypothetical protein